MKKLITIIVILAVVSWSAATELTDLDAWLADQVELAQD
jgi:hypothetical protein